MPEVFSVHSYTAISTLREARAHKIPYSGAVDCIFYTGVIFFIYLLVPG
jgi:hypothetical protein